jgi:PilZ domain
MAESERRKSPRFPMRQPVSLRVSGQKEAIAGVSQNVSKEGLMFQTSAAPPLGAKAEVVLSLESRLERNIRLAGACRVLRVTPSGENQYSVAVGCSHAFTMME